MAWAKQSKPRGKRGKAGGEPSPGGRASALVASMDKRFGDGTLMAMGKLGTRDVPVWSTGSIGLDHALGIGGVPAGRVLEVYGPEASGKTTLALHLVAEVQRRRPDAVVAFVDAEHALDVSYAERVGVDADRLVVSQPDCGEQGLEVAEALARSGDVALVVVDSVAALTPRAEIDGEMGDTHVGLQARLMSQALRKLTAVANREGVTFVFINQLRQKIGVTFGSPETTTGGQALKFYSSVRLDVRRIGTLKQGDDAVGSRTRVKVVKNKLAPPFKKAEFEVRYGVGICPASEALDLGEVLGLVQRSGVWYSLDGERLGQGRERARAHLLAHPERLASLRDAVRARLRGEEPDGASGGSADGSESSQSATSDGPAAVAA